MSVLVQPLVHVYGRECRELNSHEMVCWGDLLESSITDGWIAAYAFVGCTPHEIQSRVVRPLYQNV